jgi:hypothetical protein
VSSTAQHQHDRTFAYLLLVCPDIADPEHDVGAWSYTDIIEAFLQLEEQSAAERDMWPFGWGAHMRRIACTQVTRAFDVRPYMGRLLGSARFRFDHPSIFGGSVLFFSKPELKPLGVELTRDNKDLKRFAGVLEATVKLARERNEGVLFLGGWGWDFEPNLAPEQQVTLMAAGFPFVDRCLP